MKKKLLEKTLTAKKKAMLENEMESKKKFKSFVNYIKDEGFTGSAYHGKGGIDHNKIISNKKRR